jgi:predicted ATPase/DNA-binding winged helix-turn-helix (wHTH) protein
VSEQLPPAADRPIAFGPYRLYPRRQLLLEGDRPLRLGSRALDILTLLASRPGELISKEELVARVWPKTFVEEGNLRVHIAALRRALGDGRTGDRYVVTVPGRGYRFIAAVTPIDEERPAGPPELPMPPARDLPGGMTRMIGRADVVRAIVTQLRDRRFVTIVGPGGIGKTTVALAAADEVRRSYRDGVCFVDLSPITDQGVVASAFASSIGVAVRSDDPVPEIVAFLAGKRMLVVIDNCERVVGVAAALAEEILNRAPGVHILATSREPLRARGERVQRLAPLELPPATAAAKAAEMVKYPAIQLFVERATASSDEFKLTDDNAAVVAEICRRLDGIALAIEIAAGSIDVYGVAGLAAHLDDRFRLLTRGRRTALPRHQTLRAAFDWSFDLLSDAERKVLRRIAVFAGRFTLAAANAVAADAEFGASDVVEGIANLVAKSLVTADVGDATVHYRLLETTRAYALDKLTESGEWGQVARRQAEYFHNLFRQAEIEWDRRPSAEWLATYGGLVDDVRAALDWAFSANGDARIATALTIVAVPLWLQLSLMAECRRRVEQAIAVVKTQATPDVRRDMQLAAALGSTLVYTSMGPQARAAWTSVLDKAEALADVDYRLRALWGLWVDRLNNGNFREALALATRFHEVAAGSVDPIDPLVGDRLIGIAHHFIGNQANARRHIERMLNHYVTPIQASHIIRFQFDQRVTARAFRVRILWLMGYPERAAADITAMVEEAVSIGHVLSLCNTLGQGACPVTLLAGDLAAAERFADMLLDHAARHALGLWQTWTQCFKGILLVKRGDHANGLKALRAILREVPEIRSLPRYLALIGALADAMGRVGDTSEALATIGTAIERAERNEEGWCLSDLLRIRGELLLQEGAAGAPAAAEGLFGRAIEIARMQSALSWELRAATSLARLRRDQGRAREARESLAPVYARFTEGFGTDDLQEAKRLLSELP